MMGKSLQKPISPFSRIGSARRSGEKSGEEASFVCAQAQADTAHTCARGQVAPSGGAPCAEVLDNEALKKFAFAGFANVCSGCHCVINTVVTKTERHNSDCMQATATTAWTLELELLRCRGSFCLPGVSLNNSRTC